MFELVEVLVRLLEQWKIFEDQCKTLICYPAEADNTVDAEAFIRTLVEQAPYYQEKVMTLAEQLEAKDFNKGCLAGI